MSWEIMNPREYEHKNTPNIPLLPNIHPLLDTLYKPYDIGQVGQLDLHILAGIFGGDSAASDLTPAWNGGIYWAGQRRPQPPLLNKRARVRWRCFISPPGKTRLCPSVAQLYSKELGRKYSGLKPDLAAQKEGTATLPTGEEEQVFSTTEGPVLITTRGKLVFVAESFPLEIARKLTDLVLDAQGSGDMKMAMTRTSRGVYSSKEPTQKSAVEHPLEPLTGSLVQFFSQCGVMKAAVEAASRSEN